MAHTPDQYDKQALEHLLDDWLQKAYEAKSYQLYADSEIKKLGKEEHEQKTKTMLEANKKQSVVNEKLYFDRANIVRELLKTLPSTIK